MDNIKSYNEFLIEGSINTEETIVEKLTNLLNLLVDKFSMTAIDKLNELLRGSSIIEFNHSNMYFSGLSFDNNYWYIKYTTDPTNILSRLDTVLLDMCDQDILKGLYDLVLYKGGNIDSVFKQINQ